VHRLPFLITLVALLLISGCVAFMNLSSSSFLSSFSLEELVKQNSSPSGMICAKGGMGGDGSAVGSVGRQQSSINKTSSFSCQISAGSFDETAFVESLKADVEQEINRSGAKIVKRGLNPAGFFFEYSEGGILGRISIDGKRSGTNYYSLVAKLDEKREANTR
jgi:hypothetical protein